jgi:hypothetical protein
MEHVKKLLTLFFTREGRPIMKPFATGAAAVLAVVMLSPAPAAAFSVGAGLNLASQLKADPLVSEVQYRRHGARRYAPPPRRAVRRSRGNGLAVGLGAAAVIGILGAAAAANAAPAQQHYGYSSGYNPGYPSGYYAAPQPVYVQPACSWQRQDLFDSYGNYAGVRRVKVCH